MPFAAKLIRFILFMITFTLWTYGVSKLWARFQESITQKGFSFWLQEIMVLFPLGGLFLFVFILSGYFDNKVFFGLVIASHLGIIISAVLWKLFGSIDSQWITRGLWAGAEFGMKNPWAIIPGGIISLLIFILYPIIMLIVYITYPILSPDSTIVIFRYTLLSLFIPGWISLSTTLIGVLSDKNLEENTRSRYLINQIGGLVPMALMLSLLFWTFKGTDQLSINILTPNTSIVVIIIIFFVCSILLPYVIGTLHAKKWHIHLLEREKEWIAKTVDVLDFPVPSNYVPKLRVLCSDIEVDYRDFEASDLMVKRGIEILQGKEPEDLPGNVIFAFKDSHDLDHRFKYVSFLEKLWEEIKSIIDEFEKMEKIEELKNLASSFSQHLHSRLTELGEEIKIKGTATPALLGGLSFIFIGIMSAILSGFGKWIIENFVHSVH